MEARSWVPRRWLHPPGVRVLAFVSLLSCLLHSSEAKVFSRCELARALQEFGLEGYRGYNLADWICLAYFTSGFNTAAVDHEADGSTNNGIFQISSRKWCNNLDPQAPNLCRMYCTDLLKPNLKDTVICAMKIAQGPLGLRSWPRAGFQRRLRPRSLPPRISPSGGRDKQASRPHWMVDPWRSLGAPGLFDTDIIEDAGYQSLGTLGTPGPQDLTYPSQDVSS